MNVCPACGLPNDEDARFCKECRARLEGSTRARPNRESRNLPPPVPQPDIEAPAKLSLATVSLILGIFGIGIPAIVVGILAWRRDPLSRKRATAGIILGAAGTALFALVLILALPKGDPLHRHIRLDQVGSFTDAAYDRIIQMEEEARVRGERLGPGADDELSPVYGRLHSVKDMLDGLDDITDEDSLNVAREALAAEIDSARAYLKAH